MQLPPDTAHVWSARLDLPASTMKQLRNTLSDDEIQRADRIRHSIVQRRWIAARGILRHILSAYVSHPPKAIRFLYDAHQKPHLDFPKIGLQFNISHTEERMSCGITHHLPIGIDIEKIRPIQSMALAKRYFNKKEIAAIDLLEASDREIAFYCTWSRKEALLKAMGTGLSIPLRHFAVSIKPVRETIVMSNQNYLILPLSCETGYIGALAISTAIQTVLEFSFEKEILVCK
jgi:4'-phosphopantetheinyl transferase